MTPRVVGGVLDLGVAGAVERGVVLGAAVDPERRPVVGRDEVELGGGNVVQVQPRARPVVRHEQPAVVAEQHAARVRRIDPDLVLVEVQHLAPRVVHAQDLLAELLIGAPAVLRAQAAVAEDVDLVLVVRRHAHVAELPAVDAEDGIEILLVHLAPALAAVVRAVDLAAHEVAALRPGRLVVEERVDHLRVARRHVEAGAPHRPRRQPARHLLPRPPGVGRLVEAALGPAHQLPRPGVERPWVGRVHRHVHDTRAVVDREHVLPRRAAVGRLEHAALGVGRPEVPDGAHVHHVRVARVDDDLPDVLRVGEAHVPPRQAAVGGLEDARAGVRVAAVARLRLARADPHDIGVGGGDGDVADREGGLVLEDRRPGEAVVDRLPDVARADADVDRARVAGRDGNRLDAGAGLRRAGRAPPHALEERGRVHADVRVPRLQTGLGGRGLRAGGAARGGGRRLARCQRNRAQGDCQQQTSSHVPLLSGASIVCRPAGSRSTAAARPAGCSSP